MPVTHPRGVHLGIQIVECGNSCVNEGWTLIEEQVCKSGRCLNTDNVHIKTRYIPPGSTCAISDGRNVRVDKVLKEEPPVNRTIGMGDGMKVTVEGDTYRFN
jgi:hypothetical protein